ncbi:MAG: sulfatase [Flavobacteriaceae bacterium]|jgi:arylsulfatase A-like enzyme|nr:sulfatase [Flavobacteriaceae bacterium]
MNAFKLLFLIPISLFIIGSEPVKSSKKYNVLFIIADDLNCAIGAYGDSLAYTPNIDKLARKGVVFTNAHVQYPLCGPSRVSLMTGLYPDQTKSKQLRLYVRQTIPDVITLGQKLRMENYHSVRVGKIYHYHNPKDIGTAGHDDSYTWDRTVNPYGRDKFDQHKIQALKDNWNGSTLSWLEADGTDLEQTDGIGATETISYLDEFAKSGENFFLAYGLYRPHVPFVAPKAYFDLHEKTDFSIPESDDSFLQTIPKPAALSLRSKEEQINIESEKASYIKRAYYATTSFVDAQIGRVLTKLEETGLDKNTVVVFTSDHGFHLGEHGHWQKQTLFESATRVPLIIAGPGIENDIDNVNAPVELVDLYPTIMELLEIRSPKFLQGRSLKTFLEGSDEPIRTSSLTELQIITPIGMAQGYSIKTMRFRLNQWKFNNDISYELYDHKFDSAEMNNVSNHKDYARVLDSLVEMLNDKIFAAKRYPNGLGRQLKHAKPFKEPKKS